MGKQNTKLKRGGKRGGSGRPPNYGEETKTIAFRCPISKIPELTVIIKEKLKGWEKPKEI